MAYAEVTVVVNGAVEQQLNIHDDALLTDFIDQEANEAASHGYPTQVYILYHEHHDETPCECAQYVQDHRPAYEWNVS